MMNRMLVRYAALSVLGTVFLGAATCGGAEENTEPPPPPAAAVNAMAPDDGNGALDVKCGENFTPVGYEQLADNTTPSQPHSVRWQEGNLRCQPGGINATEQFYYRDVWLSGLASVDSSGQTGLIDPSVVHGHVATALSDWFGHTRQDIQVSLDAAGYSIADQTNNNSEVVVLRGPDTVQDALAWSPAWFHGDTDLEADLYLYQVVNPVDLEDVKWHPDQRLDTQEVRTWWVSEGLSPQGVEYVGPDETWHAFDLQKTLLHEMGHVAGFDDGDRADYVMNRWGPPGIPPGKMHDDECRAAVFLFWNFPASATVLPECD